MKLEYPQEWFERFADIEAGQTIGAGCPAEPCSGVIGQCEKCRDMGEFDAPELPRPCGWSGCDGMVIFKSTINWKTI